MEPENTHELLSRLHFELLELMRRFHAMTVDHDILYGISCGTLLGAVRERDIITFDDDIDVYIMAEDRERAQNLCGSYGLQTVDMNVEDDWWEGFKIYGIEDDITGRESYHSAPFIDVFVRKLQDGVYKTTGFVADRFLTKDEIFNRTVYKLGGLYVYGASGAGNRGGYLERVYGKKWHVPVKIGGHIKQLRPERLRALDLGTSFDDNQISMAATFASKDDGPVVVATGGPSNEWSVAVIIIGVVALAILFYIVTH